MSQISIDDPANQKPNRKGLLAGIVGLSLAAAAVAVTWKILFNFIVPIAIQPINPERAARVAHRVEVVFDDAEKSWTRYYTERGHEEPQPPNLVFFTRSQPSKCAGAGAAVGPFYCPIDLVAGFDLGFLDTLESEMSREAELGTAIVVARILASHVQRSNGAGLVPAEGSDDFSRERVLQADCLAGVWAGMAEGRVGTIPTGFYSRLMTKAQQVTKDIASAADGVDTTLSPFALFDGISREAAFARGYDTIDPTVCRDFG